MFADIDLHNAVKHSIKADLVMAIAARIKSRGLTQVEAASLLGLSQSDVSKLLRGHNPAASQPSPVVGLIQPAHSLDIFEHQRRRHDTDRWDWILLSGVLSG